MRKTLAIIISILGFNLTLFAQIDFQNPPWETGCDSLTSQLEMNICSYEKYSIADSILNDQYDTLLKYIDNQYQKEFEMFIDSNDIIQKDYLQNLKVQKESIIKSREDFKVFLESTVEILNAQYQGGSMRPMVVNMYSLELTINQIKILENIIDEIVNR
ncbi:MAG: lysozyme inhibitor LprI family protein [Crocinitomicaceae bacterium]